MSKSHLAVEISADAVRFVTLSRDRVVHHVLAPLTGKTPSDRKSSLDEIVRSNSFLSSDFDNVTLAWCGEKSTLVPNMVFNESTPQDIFELCFGKDTVRQEIDYNRISEMSIINVYDIPDWIKSFFVIKYPRVIMQHAGTHLVRQVLHSNSFKLKATLLVCNDYFRMTLVKHNNLEFYSSFSYQTAEDIIYHMNFALQQKEMTGDKGFIELIPGIGADNALLDDVKSGLERIRDLNKMTVSNEEHFMAKSQLLCV